MSNRLAILALTALATLSACGTPQERCITRNTRDLRTVDRLITETEGNLQRGYAFETVSRDVEFWDTCLEQTVIDGQATVVPTTCWRERTITERRAKAIDLKDEAKKLDSLKLKRTELARTAAPVIAQCKTDFPE